jgi:hypothetical protein
MGHGGVETEHLNNEQVDRLNRPELALPPTMAGLASGRFNGTVGQEGAKVCLMRSSVDATLAIRGLLWVGELDTTILAGGCVLRKCSK